MTTPSQQRNLSELIIALQDIRDGKNESILSPDLRELLKSGLHHSLLPETLQVSAAENFQLTHQLVGGLPRQALWADRNYGQFMKLYARQTAQTMEPVLPPPREVVNNRDWPEWMDQQRLSYRVASSSQQEDAPGDDDGD